MLTLPLQIIRILLFHYAADDTILKLSTTLIVFKNLPLESFS